MIKIDFKEAGIDSLKGLKGLLQVKVDSNTHTRVHGKIDALKHSYTFKHANIRTHARTHGPTYTHKQKKQEKKMIMYVFFLAIKGNMKQN